MSMALASTCKINSSAKPHPHACSAHHANLVATYRDARANWEQRLEAAAYGYATEKADWVANNPGPTFGAWLKTFRTDNQEH